jgi:hypothetical protein
VLLSSSALRNRASRASQATTNRPEQSPIALQYLHQRQVKTGKEYCVFLSWTHGKETQIVDVPVADPDDEQQIYQDLREQCEFLKGRWRSFFRLRTPSDIRPADVRHLSHIRHFLTRPDSFSGQATRMFHWPEQTAERSTKA